jgi:hypothetical protein
MLFIDSVILMNKNQDPTSTPIYLVLEVISGVILGIPIVAFIVLYIGYLVKRDEYEVRVGETTNNSEDIILDEWFVDNLATCANPSLIKVLSEQ